MGRRQSIRETEGTIRGILNFSQAKFHVYPSNIARLVQYFKGKWGFSVKQQNSGTIAP